MSSNELLYVKGAKVWVPHPATVWEGATVQNDYKIANKSITLLKESGSVCEIKIKNETDLPPLRNPTILIGENDLTSLSYLHEPAVLHNLEVRFRERQRIYTYCGIVLVAINPYTDLPLYGSDIIRAYRGHSMGELEPHIFAVAEEAYAKLEREKCDLSIIVSGESGAGKTVSAKYAMRYFAAVGGSESETQIERKVLASSPIMEAIGNAKTTRNDNSSRFGKFTKLLFRNDLGTMTLTGAIMQTYLLEKSRVVFQASGERNYHIFYQLCAARDQWPELILDHQDKFRYLNLGGSPDIDRVSDKDQFAETLTALYTLGFNSSEINDITKVIAGILHLGNISLNVRYKRSSEEIDHDGCDISLNDIHLNVMCGILKINPDELRKWLIMRQIESVNENVLIPNNAAAAEAARDALAKHIYAKLFQYIVGIVNKSLFSGKSQNCCFIGVLDIYGFETFENNSFEQFCINYANEKLQQQFNQHVFKLEQDEYLKEGITWTMIDFYDNQPCIDLIESKLGVLDLLDEECKMPKGSDESWARKLYEKCVKYKHFEKPRFGSTSFLVKHFSDVVEYEVHGFLEKNRDTVSKELVSVMRQSEMGLCKKLMGLEEMDVLGNDKTISVGGRVVISASKTQIMPSKQHKQSVGSQFRDSLSLLISTLHSTTPHYVRCIKPNEEKASFKWEASKVVQQLRACGVLETVRISAAGFPSRWCYCDFYNRYRLLCSIMSTNELDVNETCKNIVLKWLSDEDKYRFGHTQIFFRAGQVAYFEQIRANIRKKYIVIVQSVVRRFVYRSRYIRLQKTALGIQRYSRGLLARRTANEIRRNRAAITIQRYIKGWYYRRRFTKMHSAICGIQKYARGFIARQKYKQMLDNYKATEIQRFIRGYLARQAYKKKLRSIIKCQSAIRAFLARRLYKKLKREARTVSHMQKKYKGLENKIISLQQKIDELYKENTVYKLKVCEIPELRKQLDTKKALENEVKSLKSVLMEKDSSLMTLTKKFETEKEEKLKLMEEKDRDMKEWREQKQTWRVENEELKKQVDEMIEMAKKEHTVSFERTRLLSEVDADEVHHAYQRAIKDKQILEMENYSLKEELSKSQRLGNNLMNISSHSRSLSNASSQNDEDFGYSSAKNTLDIKKSDQIAHKEMNSLETISKLDMISSPKATHTTLILKLRKILEEEKNRNEKLTRKIDRLKNKTLISTEESLRASELEVENNKLRNDYEQLRSSIASGDEQHELEAQHEALQEELNRRREECIQLRAVLAQQSQSLKSLGSISNRKDGNNMYDGEIAEAFQAQKLVNKQLEAELMAITDENNERLEDLTKQNEELQNEKNKLYSLLYDQLQNVDDDIEKLKKNDRYLRHELQKSYMDYAVLQEKMHELENKLADAIRNNEVLSAKLREHGVADPATSTDDHKLLSVKKKTAQKFQGFYKFSQENLDKIFQRLITELTPKNAINLLPGLPAYVVFMCVRYTDLINADDQVKDLLTKYVLLVKKVYKIPNTTESRVVWLVNSITLHNLLKQYGGIDEYIKINTDTQNQQQLKNFDLSEYRQVIYESIFHLYVVLIEQIQTCIKPYIVPAILEHDEMATGSNKGRKMSQDFSPGRDKSVPEPKSLVNQLDHFYKQFGFFGLDDCYIEQIVKQLFYYICATSMNSLMLRDKLCMWKTGMQIRYNIGCLEDWARKKNMSPDVMTPLTPLIQASSLLQARKSEEDVQTIFDLCSNLTAAQVLKIIKSYNPDDCENQISNGFIEKLTAKFSERNSNIGTDSFIMNDVNIEPLKVLFKYSAIKLEEIDIPSWLKLDGLLQKI